MKSGGSTTHLSVIAGTLKVQEQGLPVRKNSSFVSVSVVSGKGGVGKSHIVACLATLLAGEGLKVSLLDGDLGLASVDTLMGLTPRYTLWDVVSGQRDVEDVVLEGPHGLRLIPAAVGVEEMANLDDYRLEVLIRSLDELKASSDAFLVDAGSGIQRQSLRLAQAARDILIVTTPEPAAVSSAYVTLKLLLSRPILGSPKIVLNRVHSAAEARRVERRIKRVSRHFLQMEPEVVGVVPEDPNVLKAVHSQEPVVQMFPRSPASMALREVANGLLRRRGAPTGGRKEKNRRKAGAA
jgi:flagellar biosynthesis protein FlhG